MASQTTSTKDAEIKQDVEVKVAAHLTRREGVVLIAGKVIMTLTPGRIPSMAWFALRMGRDVPMADLLEYGARNQYLGLIAPTPDCLDLMAARVPPGSMALDLIWSNGEVAAELTTVEDYEIFQNQTLFEVLRSARIQNLGRDAGDISWQ